MTKAPSRSRPQNARAGSRAGPLASTFLLAALSFGVTAAPPDPVEVEEPQQVLGCLIELELPSPAAEAAEGGFAFSYQSLGGEATDGRSCTVYRLRNAVGSPPTPVRWLAGSEVLVDLARLQRCSSAEECPYFEVARYFDGEFLGGATQLSFGLNADSFSVVDDGLVARTAPDVGATNASVGTEVVGALTLDDGSEVALDLVVKSRFERRDGAIALIYEVVSADPGLLSGERVALVWHRRGGPEAAHTGAGVVRDGSLPRSAAPFLALPDAAGDARPGLGPDALDVRRAEGVVAVERLVDDLAYVDDLQLDFVEPGRPDVVLLSVPLPAFVAQDR